MLAQNRHLRVSAHIFQVLERRVFHLSRGREDDAEEQTDVAPIEMTSGRSVRSDWSARKPDRAAPIFLPAGVLPFLLRSSRGLFFVLLHIFLPCNLAVAQQLAVLLLTERHRVQAALVAFNALAGLSLISLLF